LERFDAGSSSSSEHMTSISQVPKALEIIENVQKLSSTVWVNKNQCQRVAARFKAIGEGLGSDFFGGSYGSNNMDYPAFDELLTVLRKGEALVSNNKQWAGIMGALIRTDNREAFKEINEELDTMKAKFPFEGFSAGFETTSVMQRSLILAQDADKDLEEMKGLSRIQESPQATKKPEAMDLKAVEKVVWEKSQPPGDILPNFLKIDMSTINIKDPVRKLEMLSKHDLTETHGMAVVCEGSWLGCEFAVKVFKSPQSNWNKSQLLKEVGSLMELRHPHIIRFIGFGQDAQLCFVLMEMMPEKDLRHFMKQRHGRPFTRSQELDIITQIAKGMYYLHTQGYVHGDLKCSNILVKKYEDYIEVKIGDLRYAQKLESAGGSSEINMVRRPRWTPPEALDSTVGPYAGAKPTDDLLKQADVHSFAMTCYEVVTGNLPFQDVQGDALLEQIKAGKRPELPGDLDSDLKGLIESCWHNDPNQRPVFENICVVLDYIRSSMPAVTNKSSGIGKVWNVFRQIPHVQGMLNGWLSGVRDRAQPVEPSSAQSSTWAGNMGIGSGRPELVANADAIQIPECLKIKPATLKKVRKIGSGSTAKVYEVTWLGCTFALKRLKKLDNAASISALQHELDFLIQLRHPYIIQLVGFSVDEQERCSIVMEFMKGSLRDVINSRVQKKTTATKTNSSQPVLLFEFQEAVGIITKIALGMAFLHSRGVTHRDLKALNVLCQEHAGSMDVKIVDFGVSQHIAAASGATALAVGTGFWRAPEIFPTEFNRSRGCDVSLMAADVYSFAMTCYEILTGFSPFDEYGFRLSKYDEVVNGLRPTLPPGLDSGLNELIADCWHTDPERRPNFEEICSRLNTLSHC
jgi:serine/threonine protein kinase